MPQLWIPHPNSHLVILDKPALGKCDIPTVKLLVTGATGQVYNVTGTLELLPGDWYLIRDIRQTKDGYGISLVLQSSHSTRQWVKDRALILINNSFGTLGTEVALQFASRIAIIDASILNGKAEVVDSREQAYNLGESIRAQGEGINRWKQVVEQSPT